MKIHYVSAVATQILRGASCYSAATAHSGHVPTISILSPGHHRDLDASDVADQTSSVPMIAERIWLSKRKNKRILALNRCGYISPMVALWQNQTVYMRVLARIHQFLLDWNSLYLRHLAVRH